MSKLFKYLSMIRTHWKKSTFAFVMLGYGAKYGQDKYEIENMMRGYCEEAALLGDAPSNNDMTASHIAVILNPAANRRNAKKNFEKYCAPLLHLSGAYVTVVETTHEGHAKKITDQLDPNTTAVLVAGGDGTLSETVTGLMRTRSETLRVPVGVLPLGRYNTLASQLFGTSLSEVERMASATMAVLRGKTRKLNAFRVETLDGEGEKAIYGVGWIEWGTWPWLKKRVKELWYCGPLKNYIPLLWTANDGLKPSVSASLAYTAPCSGCSKCFEQRPDLMASVNVDQASQSGGRWWGVFVKKPSTTPLPGVDYKTIENEACDQIERKLILSTSIRLSTDTICESSKVADEVFSQTVESPPSLVVGIADSRRYQGEFLFEGLKYLKGGDIRNVDKFQAKQIEIRPSEKDVANMETQDDMSSEVLLIDNEEFELRPIRVTILPNSLTVFCL